MSSIAIIGGNGFIGSHIAKKLKKEHHHVVLCDKYLTYDTHMDQYLYSQYCVDITADPIEDLVRMLEGTDYVYHLASVSNTYECVKNPIKATDTNCLGTIRLLEACRKADVKRVIIASSSLISGLSCSQLWDEGNVIDVSRSDHLYVTTKLFQEMVARDYYEMYGLPYTILRYGICYGPQMTPGVVVHNFIDKVFNNQPMVIQGNGEQWRQYIYVENLADFNVKVLNQKAENKTYNVVGSVVSILDIARTICKYVPSATIKFEEPRSHDLKVTEMDNQLAYEDFRWTPTHTLDEGIKKTLKYYEDVMGVGKIDFGD
jgi:UDP-glucose 4-epimerase